ncbi:FtsX-like permease family protein [Natronorubrum sp. JWXQ-INN-674]|uniref:FtsX-like permease family protein n=1 Tax=Natronorubrum halalkaliphilum TaxID=2691917 RepID=A0A6B0VT00_9EURY|nr:ABC transporter permease [Natronorubrum halalkaliphilum]MXV64197.1 FtsX-like permease family protein [Natronorubrum halalkaliphilum]
MGGLRAALGRLRVAGGITVGQLRHHRLRLGLAIIGVGLAVLAMTLLAGVGMGVLETGEQQFEAADRDLWVTAGETRLTPAGGGGFENSLTDSRSVAAEMEGQDGVANAVPLAFETVYVGTDSDGDFQTFIGTGVPGTGSIVQVSEGERLSGDPHYAEGSYDGERTNEVLIDEETARALDIEIGDTIHAGGSLAAARNNEFTVVGVSPTFERMLGAPTVVMPLSELHQATGTTQTEPATFITITVEDGADTDAVQTALSESHPEYEIRSNQEQLEAVLEEQILVLAAGGALIVLALVAGVALTHTLLTLVIFQQRAAFAALSAQGISSSLLVASVVGQGLAIGLIGGLVGLVLTPPAVELLNRIAAAVVGFDGLVQTAPEILAAALAVAIVIGTIAAALAGWRVSRTPPLEHL